MGKPLKWLTKCSGRNGFERSMARPGPHGTDCDGHNGHAGRYEHEDAARAELAQEEGDDEGAEDRRETAEGIDEADGHRADARRIELRLIGVKRERHGV